MLIDLNKRFYIQNKDIILLDNINAIRETVKNILLLNEYDIPMSDLGANINVYQLKTVNHPSGVDMVNRIDESIRNIDYVEDVDITFFYEGSNKEMTIKVKVRDLDESIDMSLNLSDIIVE